MQSSGQSFATLKTGSALSSSGTADARSLRRPHPDTGCASSCVTQELRACSSGPQVGQDSVSVRGARSVTARCAMGTGSPQSKLRCERTRFSVGFQDRVEARVNGRASTRRDGLVSHTRGDSTVLPQSRERRASHFLSSTRALVSQGSTHDLTWPDFGTAA